MKEAKAKNIWQEIFSLKKILAVLIISVAPVLLGTLQFALGYGRHQEFEQVSLGYNYLYSLAVTASLFFGCASIIAQLNRKLPWEGNIKKRILVEIALIFSYTTIAQYLIIVVLASTPIFTLPVTGELIFNNILFSNTITLIVVAIIESIYFFNNWKESLVAAERLEKEHLQSNLSNLRSQLDPHFMFNSLNVLSSLIRTDSKRAEQFVDDFAKVYRYLLDVRDEMVVPLKDELAFVERYLALQKIRFGEALQYEVSINPEHLNYFLPPLSLQELAGNAIKHNVLTSSKPLQLKFSSSAKGLLITNNVQARQGVVDSTGIGLTNLKARYRYLSSDVPRFDLNHDSYQAYLPLIKLQE